ncbi:MAG TPA: hypothetical protein VGR97_14845 [Candidatus Acidoferrales bacterium]|nr:hypothetical protein [Candidatus Acidoferrales bacterium]
MKPALWILAGDAVSAVLCAIGLVASVVLFTRLALDAVFFAIGRVKRWWKERRERESRYEAEWDRSHGL